LSAASGQATASITINPVNNAATFGGTFSVSLTETDSAQNVGTSISVSDIDSSATMQFSSVARLYGIFTMQTNGSWNYAMNANNQFSAGQVYSDSATFYSADGTSVIVTANITGTNDAPTASSSSITIIEDSGFIHPLTVTGSDIDGIITKTIFSYLHSRPHYNRTAV